jgi:hypothetical protein
MSVSLEPAFQPLAPVIGLNHETPGKRWKSVSNRLKCNGNEILQFPRLTRGDDKIFRRLLLKHQVHGLHVLGSSTPVSLYFDVPKLRFLLPTLRDSASRLDNLLGNEPLGDAMGIWGAMQAWAALRGQQVLLQRTVSQIARNQD